MATNHPILSIEEIWRRYDAIEARLTAPVSERMLDLANLQPGMHLLDLATGRGEPAIRAAHRVAPHGSVVGIEPSDTMLQMARQRADREGITNLDLRAASAELLAGIPHNHFHATTIRWGLMYMTQPVTALENAHRALLSTGVLVAALWAEPERVPYFTLPRHLLQRYKPLTPIDLEAPGTFRYATIDRIERDLTRAGFALDHIEEMDVPVFEAQSAEEMVAWVRAFGLTPLLNDLPEDQQIAWEQEFTSEVERRRMNGVMRLGGVTRIVRAVPR